MKNTRWRAMIEITLLAALVVGLAAVIQRLRVQVSMPGAPQVAQYPAPTDHELTSEITEKPAPVQYPAPTQPGTTLIWTETPTIESTQGIPNGLAYPQPFTPWPTFTPFPSPTLQQGPTSTLIHPIEPAQDAAGSIRFLEATGAGNPELKSFPVDSQGLMNGEVTKLVEDLNIHERVAYPSPDGSRIAFMDESWGGGSLLYVNSGKLVPMFADTIDPQSRFLDWSPDNRHLLILAQANYPDDGLWLVDTDTWEHAALAIPGIGSIRGGAISPNGQRVVYLWRKDSSEPREVWMVNADGQDAHMLFTVNSYAAYFSWSPDGSKVVIDGDGLMIMDVESEQLQKLATSSCVPIHYAPQWSPDGRFLAIMRDTDRTFVDPWRSDAFQGANICLVDVEKGVSRPLLDDNSEGYMYPTWSPDGSKVAFVSDRSGKSEVWVVNVDGSKLHQLTHTTGVVRFPVWVRP